MSGNLVPYARPSNFIGETWEGWLVFAACQNNRDACLLTRVNYKEATKQFEALPVVMVEKGGETVGSVRFVTENHWACGWVEWIAIHPSNAAAVELAEKLGEKLEGYPILNESALSAAEVEAAQELWAIMSLRERISLIKEYAPKGSIFAARHECIPGIGDSSGKYDSLDERIRSMAAA